MKDEKLWNLMREAWGGINPHYAPVLERLSAESGLEVSSMGLVLAAKTFEPETITPRRLQLRIPYTAAESYLVRLSAAAEKGCLEEVSPDEYRSTEAGHALVGRTLDEVRAAMAGADPLSAAEGQRLAHLLGRLVEASLEASTPPEKWSIYHSARLMPPLGPPLPYIEQAFSCLNAYRDDAHLAAWRPSSLSATALESLTLLWRGEAESLDALCEQLNHRGHPRQVYADALAELRERGFVEGPDDGPKVTEAGQVFRDEVEADTDRYFFAPWSCLDDGDRAELADLLTRLREGLSKDD